MLAFDTPALAPDLLSRSLEGSVAVVTGGTRGIGLACTVGLATLGATVVVIGRSPGNVEVAVEALVGQGLDVVGQVADVADSVAVRALPARLGPLGKPDLLVCAAGVMTVPTAKTLRTEQQEWDRVLGTNLTGVFTTVSTFVPAMAARRSGRVVVLSACLGRMSGPGCAGGFAPYRISKAGVNALVRNLAHETGSGTCSWTPSAPGTAGPTWAVPALPAQPLRALTASCGCAPGTRPTPPDCCGRSEPSSPGERPENGPEWAWEGDVQDLFVAFLGQHG